MARHEVHVICVVNDTTVNHKFTCDWSSRYIGPFGAVIEMRNGVTEDGRRIGCAQYRQAEVILNLEVD